MDVTIVGGGIGGLVTALELHRQGITSRVYEQGQGLRELGVGINLLPHAVRVLDDLDLLEALDTTAVRTARLTYANRFGQPIWQRACGLDAGFSLPQYSCHRGHLQRVLLDAVRERLGDDAVLLGHRLTGFAADGDGVTARFGDKEVRSDVLVGADGIHSVVRAQLFPGEGPPRWNGIRMWRGAVDWPAFGPAPDQAGRSMVIAGGNEAKLVVYPIGPGATPGTVLTNWAICIQDGRDGDPPPQRQDWSRVADPADPAREAHRFRLDETDHHALVAATPESYEFPMCDRDPLPYWSDGRVTLLGDAAHPMYPMGSNGAGQSILDAESLAGHLASTDVPAALRAYQDERLPVTAEIVHRNRVGGPESVIDEVERRAPDGFDALSDVISDEELEAIVGGYARAAGATPEQVRR